MKCPACVKEGERSRVFIGSTSSMPEYGGVERYYDEDGRYHQHDRSTHTTDFSCSRGHVWSVRRVQGCQSCGTQHREEVGAVSHRGDAGSGLAFEGSGLIHTGVAGTRAVVVERLLK